MKIEWIGFNGFVAVITGWNGDIDELKQFVLQHFPFSKLSKGCDDDEAFHFKQGNTVYHVCFTDPYEVYIFTEDYDWTVNVPNRALEALKFWR